LRERGEGKEESIGEERTPWGQYRVIFDIYMAMSWI
jgi:hypothetical protein